MAPPWMDFRAEVVVRFVLAFYSMAPCSCSSPLFQSNHSWFMPRRGYAMEIQMSSGGSGEPATLPPNIRLSVGSFLRMEEFCTGGYESINQPDAYCRVGRGHTGCVHKTVDAQSCGTVFGRKISASEKQMILDMHNAKRRRVANGQETRGINGSQPAATNMVELTWDDEAAALAQLWADQCTFRHDVDRRTVGTGSVLSTGQNIYMSLIPTVPTSAAWGAVIDSWYNEVDRWERSRVASYPGGIISADSGHYTQLIWGTTSRVGCGYMAFREGSQGSYKRFHVCNYVTAGNLVGTPVYRTGGSPCSSCPSTHPRCNSGLCRA